MLGKNCALFVGRFQPFHLGHLHAIKLGLEENERLELAIGSAQESRTLKNPFSASERREMVSLALGPLARRVRITEIEDFFNDEKWTTSVLKKCGKASGGIYSNNPETFAPLAKAGVAHKKIPNYKGISATLVRKLIIEGKGKWKTLVPKTVADYLEKNGLDRVVREIAGTQLDGQTLKSVEAVMKRFSFSQIRRASTISKNRVFICRRGREKFILKKYVSRKGLEKEFFKRVKNEIDTRLLLQYDFSLPPVYAYDAQNAYLITRMIPLKKVRALDRETALLAAELLARLHKTEIPDNPFLFKYGFSYYHTTLHHMLSNLLKKGALSKKEAEKVDGIIESSKALLEKSGQTFVHGDYHLENLFYSKKALIPLDFEYAGVGSPVYDLAVFLFSANGSPHKKLFLQKYFEKAGKLQNFEKLMRVMLARRCIELMHAFADNAAAPQYQKARKKLSALISPA